MKSLESLELRHKELIQERIECETAFDSKYTSIRDGRNELSGRIDSYYSLCNQDVLNQIDAEFESQTGLTGKDISFLLLATTLQCLRQYFVTDFKKRLGDKEAAENTRGHNPEHAASRRPGWYYASKEEIKYAPVPFDAMNYSTRAKNIGIKHGLSGTTHRTRALGHDPILGLYFGTANILTKTVTLNTLQSYHIKKGMVPGKNGTSSLQDTINCQAFNHKIADAVKSRVKEEPVTVAAALLKEIVHLRSDIKTTKSLPLPFISTYDDKLAMDMADYGFDMANVETVGKQAAGAALINFIIACIHRRLREDNTPENLYEVRTRKVITYSNLIATYSNVFATTLAPCFGKNLNSKIDLGGYVYTFCNAMNTIDFIYNIKSEFIVNNLINKINLL